MRTAQAQTCPAGQTQVYKVTAASAECTGGWLPTFNNSLPAIGSNISSAITSLNNWSAGATCYHPSNPQVYRVGFSTASGSASSATANATSNDNGVGYASITATAECATSCTAGQIIGTGSSANMGSAFNSTVCSNGCLAQASTNSGEICVQIGTTEVCGRGDSGTQWTLTGAACPTSSAPPSFKQSTTCVGIACVVAAPSASVKATGNGSTIDNTQNVIVHTDGSASTKSTTPTPPGPNGVLPRYAQKLYRSL